MKIHTLGASGSGTTTLGTALGNELGYLHLDADDFYWEKTSPPFQKKVMPEIRNQRMHDAFLSVDNVVISGSMFSWGEYWKSAFDLVVFLYVVPEERMKRLRQRERERYGDLLDSNPVFASSSKAFLDWAAGYDHSEFSGRSLKLHNQWLEEATCPVLRVDASHSNPTEVLNSVLEFINTHH